MKEGLERDTLNFLDLNRQDKPREIARDRLYEKSLVLLYGATGIGKSFVALDIAACLACGLNWPIQSGAQQECSPHSARPVMYWLGEGVLGYEARVRAWSHARLGALNSDLHFLNFFDDKKPLYGEDKNKTFEVLKYYLNEMKSKNANNLPILVIDTLASLTPGMDENKGEHVTLLLADLAYLIQETGATIIIIHHTGKYSTTPRGHSSLTGSADTVLRLRQVGKLKVLELTVEKQRHAQPAEPLYFSLSVQPIDGRAPVPQQIRRPSISKRKKRELWSARERAIFYEIKYLLENNGKTLEDTLPMEEIITHSKYGKSSVYAAVEALSERKILSRPKNRIGKKTTYWVTFSEEGRNKLNKYPDPPKNKKTTPYF